MAAQGAGKAARSARLVHHIPGRLRIRIEGAHGEAAFFEGVRRRVVGLSGVESVRVNAASSSVVICYVTADRGFASRLGEQAQLADWLRLEPVSLMEHGFAALREIPAEPLPDRSHVAQAILSTSSRLDTGLRHATNGYLDLKVLVPLLLAVAGPLSSRRQQGTPLWLTLVISALSSFVSLHSARTEAQVAAPPPDSDPEQIRMRLQRVT